MGNEKVEPGSRRPKLIQQEGRLWFSGESERRFYFILTVIMLAIGILYKMGLL